jgi:ABC-type molybdenum transport system ATPase subunit/photorepair protein PhrA
VTAQLITGIRVKGLFGLYTYELPKAGDFSDATILYGDNGVGKSTLLRLVFHLLSAADDRGHRTALYQADFERLEVDLSSGHTLTAQLQKDLPIRLLSMEVTKNGRKLAVWNYERRFDREYSLETEGFVIEVSSDGLTKKRSLPQKKREHYAVPIGNQAYLSALAEVAPTMFLLNAERRLDSDTVPSPSDEMELRRVLNYREPKRITELVVRSREIALSQALNAAAQSIGRKAIIGANQGSMNVHSVYINVLHHVLESKPNQNDSLSESTIDTLLNQLSNIETKTAQHARYELATELSTVEFRKALSAKTKKTNTLAVELLKPYIRSLEGRLDAVEPIYQTIDRFVSIVNSFLNDKTIFFKLSQGFSIHNRLGNPLTPAQLSSGEQQLILLFCYVLIARDKPSVFMIDEPEISLNIKWQRQLIQSLLDITAGAPLQFIFASHSMELLAQHRGRVVKLVNKT